MSYWKNEKYYDDRVNNIAHTQKNKLMALFLDEECGYKNDFVGENREWGKTDSL